MSESVTVGKEPKLYVVLAMQGEYSRMEYVGHRVAASEEEVLREFADKDRLTVVPVHEFGGVYDIRVALKNNIDSDSLTENKIMANTSSIPGRLIPD